MPIKTDDEVREAFGDYLEKYEGARFAGQTARNITDWWLSQRQSDLAAYKEWVERKEEIKKDIEKYGKTNLNGNTIFGTCKNCKEDISLKDDDILWSDTSLYSIVLALLSPETLPTNTK